MSEPIIDERADASRAADEARARLRQDPGDGNAYRALGQALRQLGDTRGADEAALAAIRLADRDPDIARAHQAMLANDIAAAEGIVRSVLVARPDDVVAIRLLAEIAIHFGQPRKAEALLRRAVELAPSWFYARYTLAVALDMLSRAGEALDELNRITGPEAGFDPIVALRAVCLSRIGEHQEALRLYRTLAARQPTNVDIWISIANLQKIVGDEGAAETYRKVLQISGNNGEAWWSLANLKTYRFSDHDVAAMQAALASEGLADNDRLRLHFALGKALEDRGEVDASFDHYRQGNSIRSVQTRYQPAETTALVDAAERLFTSEFLDARKGWGCDAPDPIFIVGMPRAGSTLVEQILASHPLVEGTGELADVIVIARELEENSPGGLPEGWRNYPAVLADLSADDVRGLGQAYVDRTRIQRKTDQPFFTDKMPNNWLHVGLIRLMLPNAKIVDARRHPLACGLSNFKQHYARGQEFSYDLEHFGQYYRDYVRLMEHFDRVSPGRIHRLIHENLLTDPEREIRKLLDFLGLPFDDACLSFHRTKRAVRTASAEQVRRPINADGIEHWKQYEQWLEPLKAALGPALDGWKDDAGGSV